MLLFDDSKKLEKVLGEEAASVIARAFEKADDKWRRDLATRADLVADKAEVKEEIVAVRSELKQEIVAVRSELKQEIAAVRSELKQEIAELRSEFNDTIDALRSELREENAAIRLEMQAMKHDMLRWLVGCMLAQTALLAAVLAVLK